MSDTPYWKSPEELDGRVVPSTQDELPSPPLGGVDRRGFLKASGFALGAVAAACRRAPIDKAIPYLVQPEEVVPGRSLLYASVCGGCSAGCGALVKCRDGRPIKLEGNPAHGLSQGGLCAAGQASLLGLYDTRRLRDPSLGGEAVSWSEVDERIAAPLETSSGRVRLLTGSLTSPTERALVARFLVRFPTAKHVVYDPLSSSAILAAHQRTHGRRLLPRYRFDRADVVISLGADFLGTWISPVEHTSGWRQRRRLADQSSDLSYHVQLEGRMSITGSKADRRLRVDPTAFGPTLTHLDRLVRRRAGVSDPFGALADSPLDVELLEELAERLWSARGRALVVSDSQSVTEQVLVNDLNDLLAGYGATLDVERPSLQRQGDDRALAELFAELGAGTVDLLVVRGVNPAYDLPGDVAEALGRVPLLVSCAGAPDETSALAGAVCPEPHFLEAWSDSEPVAGNLAVVQPALRPLGRTRSFAESLAAWMGEPAADRDLVQSHWRESILPRSGATAFEPFWNQVVHDGWLQLPVEVGEALQHDRAAVQAAYGQTLSRDEFSLELYPKVSLGDGRHAHNPWLQELPDPVTKVTWDNYACLGAGAAARLGVTDGDVVRLEVEGQPPLELPAFVQPGQHEAVVAVALGYGRAGTDRFAAVGPEWLEGRPTVLPGEAIGANVAPWTVVEGESRQFRRQGVRLSAVGRRVELASTQTHHYLSAPSELLARTDGIDRPIVQETTLAAYRRDPAAGGFHPHIPASDLWGEHEFPEHHWGLAIDLSACTGCSACVVACQAENNVPVVGKDEVRRRREMHWLRIDRYYRGAGADVDVVHQPMMCHHCDNAPCETVCPVLATLHSSEGLNQQAYNRCVGTRYCANNCPYKVRRFNWFDYPHEDRLQNLALNPDVVVRSRGVMEKCSLCVQRIQETKHEAGRLGLPVADGDIRVACEQSCPAQAIVFGDRNDKGSRLVALENDPRHYWVLEELNVKPSIGYLRLVRNREAADDRATTEHGEETKHV